MKKPHSSLATLALGLSLSACAATADDRAAGPWPPAGDGHARYIVDLPALQNENEHKVELIAGKTMEVDCNARGMGGRWQDKTIEGWGYGYYELSGTGPVFSTMMACPEDSRREAFVQVGGEPKLVRYNSKLPLVIYAPDDVEIRYRIWSAAPDSQPAPRR
ncbi:serine protease inhibitor ecotin [Thauera linaloolentis]|uniref:Proteinase inhibitor I11, ecotin n=1 Tax=Thauera linaloolentis (strain DSM 12138 / JCM 21573 / CCUG 41526 / CIP 105981 / IAM 15112 / NBRC 102519 / 47Lol) TaxID=1123367 RepID=N6YPB4_THAL4|nr:serine protease inhibitor ecotin [Thauera linaloolentis]ENO84028.1 proteinase inhibitor I11, ecotin [Thauera linaloolentis 47Lol = DSM 12138]MCM8565121.1 serine protease inhibitor ecotin [Thauera linaloolentis]